MKNIPFGFIGSLDTSRKILVNMKISQYELSKLKGK